MTGHSPVVQIRSNQVIKLDPMTHLDIVLDLQVLNRSTHLVLHPNYKGGEIFLSSIFSTSVTAKHEFRQVFFFNSNRQIIQIPSGYIFYTINGLLNFPFPNSTFRWNCTSLLGTSTFHSPSRTALSRKRKRVYSNLSKLSMFYLPTIQP